MNVKNVILIAVALCGGALFLVLQKHSKDHDSSFEQPMSPAIVEPDAGYHAPDFTLADLDNNEFKLSDSEGDVVIMTFWTTW